VEVLLGALKDLRIIYLPGSLVGDEPQFVTTFLNCTHDGCQPSVRGSLSVPWHLIGSVLGESVDDAQAKAQRENDP
jgi:Rieske Fe-S protein